MENLIVLILKVILLGGSLIALIAAGYAIRACIRLCIRLENEHKQYKKYNR